MATELAPPAVFPIAFDPSEDVSLAREFATNIMTPAKGPEVRSATRDRGVRIFSFSVVFGSSIEGMRFRALWLASSDKEPLRFIVPLWTRGTFMTELVSATEIAGDFSDVRLAADDRVMLWTGEGEDEHEIAEIESITPTLLTTKAPLSNSYPAHATRVMPVMNAWLEPPSLEQRSSEVETAPLTFREELSGIAGIDPDVGHDVEADAATLDGIVFFYGWPTGVKKEGTLVITAFDVLGLPIQKPQLTITVDPDPDDFPETTHMTFPNDGTEVHVHFVGNAFVGYIITVESGSATPMVRLIG